MTKRDFELIASILADAESRIESDADCSQFSDEQTSYASEILDTIVANFAKKLGASHPRFNRPLFETWSMPIHAYRLKRSILAKLAK